MNSSESLKKGPLDAADLLCAPAFAKQKAGSGGENQEKG
jgi:hypothetical protein